MYLQKIAEQHGCHQCLWLFGEDHEITEVITVHIDYICQGHSNFGSSLMFEHAHQVGAMNLFILLELPDGSKELVTPPLSTGVILPGVTRYALRHERLPISFVSL